MKFSIERKELAAGLSRIIGTVPKRVIMPTLSNIKVEIEGDQVRLTATDMDTTSETVVNAKISEAGDSVLLPAQRLYDTVAALPDSTLKVSISDKFRVTIETGTAKYQLTGMDTAEYPVRTEVNDIKGTLSLPTERLRALVDTVGYATSRDEFRPAMTGVLFQVRESEFRVVTTDGFRLATRKEVFTEPITEIDIDAIISSGPLKAALKHITDENVSIELYTKRAVFRDSITTVVMRQIDETYPNWSSIIPSSNDNRLILRRDDLLSTLKRVSLYSNVETKQVRFNLKGDNAESSLIVMADDLETGGEAKESVPVQYSGEKIEIGLSSVFLKDALAHIDCDEVEFHIGSPLRALLMYPAKQGTDNEYFHLMMPIRLNQ